MLGGYITKDGKIDFVPFSPSMGGHQEAIAAGLIPADAVGGFSFAVQNGKILGVNWRSTLNKGDVYLPKPAQQAIKDALERTDPWKEL